MEKLDIQKANEKESSPYDFRFEEKNFYRNKSGLTKEIVEQLSKDKNDPEWMTEFRLKALELYETLKIPEWGPDISDLHIENIATYVRPNTKMQQSWDDVPEDIKQTFEKLGIPEAERTSLAGVGAQYDSELVYHNLQDEVAKQGVIYTDFESSLKGPYILCNS